MPAVRPFRAITYAPERFAQRVIPERVRLPDEPDAVLAGRQVTDLTDLACPPYDVIGPQLQAELMGRHDRNAVRLELPPGGDPHGSAAATLARVVGGWHPGAPCGAIGLLLRPRLDRAA